MANTISRCPVIEYEANCLIVRHVQFNNGKYYDVRIKRYDEAGSVIPVNSLYLREDIQKIADIAADRIFQTQHMNPTKNTIRYESGLTERCCTIGPNQQENPLNCSDPVQKEVFEGAREIHQVLNLFHQGAWTDQNEALWIAPVRGKPRPKPLFTQDPYEISPFEPFNEQEEASSEEGVSLFGLDKGGSPAAKSRAETIRALDGATEDLRQNLPFLKNTTLKDLQEYSMRDAKDPTSDVGKVYAAYQELAANAQDTSTDEKQQLRKWLQALYEEHRKTLQADSTLRESTEEKKQLAAKQVLGFIRLKKQEVTSLIQSIVSGN